MCDREKERKEIKICNMRKRERENEIKSDTDREIIDIEEE